MVAILVMVVGSFWAAGAAAQSTSAGVSGRITDSTGAVIVDAEVQIKNVETGVTTTVKTNGVGLYNISGLNPGQYLISSGKPGFKTVTVTDLVLNVQDNVVRNFSMQVGSISETVTINGNGLNVNTTDAAVGTVVDRQFVENIPLNGRSFQSLLTLAPGIVQVPTGNGGVGYTGEISVNGQRTEANNYTVDGVSVNTGTFAGLFIAGAGYSGSLPGETILGTTQSMVPIDALQEFRGTTSTYSAEYGRTPGGQFSFSTRSGTNSWNGSAYDYLRNGAMDANNWFNNAANPQISRQAERQNDFGGVLGGPIVIPGLYNGKDKTFFFFSYEGVRLTAPQPLRKWTVPDVTLRQQAPPAVQPFLNAFALPNGGEDGLNDGLAFYNLAYSAPSSLDNVGIRVDHNFGDKLKLFGRYASTPSSAWTWWYPAIKGSNAINVRTFTLGAASSLAPTQSNELHFNVTHNNAIQKVVSTNFGGATVLDFSLLPGPNGQPLTPINSGVEFLLAYGGFPLYQLLNTKNEQRQFNLTDTFNWSHGAHQFRFGVDWRRLSTFISPVSTFEIGLFGNQNSVMTNSAGFAGNGPYQVIPATPVYHNYSVFAQDEWKAAPRLSFSLGLRWDINPAPGNLTGPLPATVNQATDPENAKLAPVGTPLWKTDWHGFAPRVGVAYQLRQSSGHETVVRAGFGLFYDMGNTQGSTGFNGVGFTSSAYYFNVPLPLSSTQMTLSPPSTSSPYNATVYGFDPHLKLPYTMQWNLALEQALGSSQSVTVNYVGSAGRKLLTEFFYSPGTPDFALGNGLALYSNRANSDYSSLQIKYQKRLSRGLQALASYTWSHSIDDISSNLLVYELVRASSDFDVRHNLQAAITYDFKSSYENHIMSAVLGHWGLDWRISARSALPVDILDQFTVVPGTTQSVYFHPNVVPNQPIYLYGSQYPGGRIINYSAFTSAPAGIDGDAGRNFARGFDAVNTDVALRRDFPIRERLHLQFRAEAFNVLNHSIFGNINNSLSAGPYNPVTRTGFGLAQSTLNNALGGLNSLYQTGGPRSLQLMLKLQF